MTGDTLAYLGLGAMGAGMAARLLETGSQLTVWNRTGAKTAPLELAGAVAAATPAAAVAGAGTVMVSLADESAVDAVLFGQDGAATAMLPGAVLVNTSTLSPRYAVRLADRLEEIGVAHLEANVLGNPFQARSGELRVFTSGPARHAERVRPVLERLGKQVVHVGPAGNAAATKLVFNALLGAQLASLAEAVGYGVRVGLDRDRLLAAIAESGFSSLVMSFRAGLVREGRYAPAAFRSALMAKDLRLVLGEAAESGHAMPVIEASGRHFDGVVASGDGDLDAAVLVARLATAEPAARRAAGAAR